MHTASRGARDQHSDGDDDSVELATARATIATMSVGRLHAGSELRTERVPVAGPWVTEREVQYVAEAAEHDWYQNAGRSVPRFEAALAEYIGVRHAAAVPHCTSALHLALLALGVGPGDEVIVPESTWVATAAPIFYVGARPVFADIDPTTWCMAPESVERVRHRPHQGRSCRSTSTAACRTWTRSRRSPSGTAWRSSRTPPSRSDRRGTGATRAASATVATFSFHGTKIADDGRRRDGRHGRSDLRERISSLRDHGRTAEQPRFFTTDEIAYKYKMSSLQAAFGLAQIERIEELVAQAAADLRVVLERASATSTA